MSELRPFTARVREVIETNLDQRGNGTDEDPFRRITQYYSLDGELLCERDEFLEERLRKAS